MNQLKIFFVILCMGFLSCQKNNELHYPQNKKLINLWLGTAAAPLDSVTYNFAYAIPGRDSVMFYYRLAGYPLDHDAEFELQAVSGDTNRVYYSLGKYTIKAGQYESRGAVYIIKPNGYAEFAAKAGKIVFKVKPSEVFEEGAKELSALNVVFKNYVAKPDNWDAAPYPYFAMSRYFGAYSNVKYAFVIQTTGMVDFKIYYTVSKDPLEEPNTITATEAAALQSKCKVALQIHNAQHGTLKDENNNDVIFP